MSDWDSLPREEKLAFWDESEHLLTELLGICGPYLTAHQMRSAKELIDHNEHLLALEFLFDYLDETQVDYPEPLLDKFRRLDARLHLTGRRNVDRLGRG
jgi:hypothetical protein